MREEFAEDLAVAVSLFILFVLVPLYHGPF